MEELIKYSFIGVPLLLSFVLLIIMLCELIIKRKVGKARIILVVSNLLIMVAIFVLYYFVFTDKEFMLYVSVGYVLFFLTLYILITCVRTAKNINENNNYHEFITSLNKTDANVYFLCDKKDRIREISDNFLVELDLKRKDVIGKKAFDVFDKKIRFTKVNDNDVTNKKLREYYKKFGKEAKQNSEYKREIFMQNANGQTILLNLVEKPLYVGGIYQGRLNIGQKKTDESLTHVEMELNNRSRDLESIQYKFIAALELTEEGIFFNDLNQNSIWGNEIWAKDLKINSNNITIMDYKALIHPDDVNFYIAKLKDLTVDNPTYEMRYRLRMNGTYQYVWEKGKRIFEDPNSNVILGYAKKMNTDFFEHTGIKEIDEVKHMEDLKGDMMGLFYNHHLFSLVSINLTNLPDINKQYGRQVGNIMIGEYLKRLKINFQTESSGIYRSSGLLFYFTITDGRKMELFKRGLISNGNAMNLAMNIGGVKVELQVNMGIAEAITDAVDPENLIKCSNEAIKASMVPNSGAKFVYYKDIKDLNI